MEGAIPEKGNRRVTRHLGKGAVQLARERKEEKVRCFSREGRPAYIDGVEAVMRPENNINAVGSQRDT